MKIKKEYLKNLIRQKSLKQRRVAIAINVSPQDFNNWMFRGVFPHFDKLQEVAKFLEVEVGELTTEKLLLETDGNSSYQNHISHFERDSIPFYDLDSKSMLSFLGSKLDDYDPSDYVHVPGLSADFAVPYFGKEMEPIISSGDLIALRKIKDHSFFNYGNIYLVTTKEHVIIRTLNASSKPDHLLLSANDRTIDSIEIPLKKIISTHLVVSIIKRQVI